MKKKIDYNQIKKEIEEEKRLDEVFREKQLIHNSKIPGFEEESINRLILEKLTILTCNNRLNKRYFDEIPTDIIHEQIQDLGVLYQIRSQLQGSYKSQDRND